MKRIVAILSLAAACAFRPEPAPAKPPADPIGCAAANAKALEVCARSATVPASNLPTTGHRAPECIAETAAAVTACLPAP